MRPKYVKTKNGVRAYLRYEPTYSSGYYVYDYEKAKVTVLARENRHSLVKTNGGMVGHFKRFGQQTLIV